MNSQCHVAYIYTPKLAESVIPQLVAALAGAGIKITHLGKNDPPRKWRGTDEQVAELIWKGNDLTNWTFGRDSRLKVEFTIELHRDPRWSHDSISLSGCDLRVIESLATAICKSSNAFMAISGILGMGKEQQWNLLWMSDSCPAELKRVTTGRPSAS
jgi:hypothetical protein